MKITFFLIFSFLPLLFEGKMPKEPTLPFLILKEALDQKGIFSKRMLANDKAVMLIDTFGFFSPACNQQSEGRDVRVQNYDDRRDTAYNYMYVYRLQTKEGCLVVGFFDRASGSNHDYYYDIDQKQVKIVGYDSGAF